ncbi:unnamed protein product [Sphagnum balticum]
MGSPAQCFQPSQQFCTIAGLDLPRPRYELRYRSLPLHAAGSHEQYPPLLFIHSRGGSYSGLQVDGVDHHLERGQVNHQEFGHPNFHVGSRRTADYSIGARPEAKSEDPRASLRPDRFGRQLAHQLRDQLAPVRD